MSAIAWATVQDALYDAVKAALPTCAVVWVNPVAPMPAKPFAMLALTQRDMPQGLPGRDEVNATATAGTVKYSFHRRHMLSVNVYSNTTFGDGHATALLAQLSREIRKDARTAALFTAGVKLGTIGQVQDLSALLDTRAESRAQVDITIGTLDNSTEAVGWIETVDLSGIKVDGVAI